MEPNRKAKIPSGIINKRGRVEVSPLQRTLAIYSELHHETPEYDQWRILHLVQFQHYSIHAGLSEAPI